MGKAMSTADRVAALATSAGAAGDEEMVRLCALAEGGDAEALARCLYVCREAEVNAVDVREWCATARAGDCLAEYWDGEDDPGSRCGWSDPALDEIRRRLSARGLRIVADDRGLVVVAVDADGQ